MSVVLLRPQDDCITWQAGPGASVSPGVMLTSLMKCSRGVLLQEGTEGGRMCCRMGMPGRGHSNSKQPVTKASLWAMYGAVMWCLSLWQSVSLQHSCASLPHVDLKQGVGGEDNPMGEWLLEGGMEGFLERDLHRSPSGQAGQLPTGCQQQTLTRSDRCARMNR